MVALSHLGFSHPLYVPSSYNEHFKARGKTKVLKWYTVQSNLSTTIHVTSKCLRFVRGTLLWNMWNVPDSEVR